MNKKLETSIVNSMLKECKNKQECNDWLDNKIKDSYSRAENFRAMKNGIGVRVFYEEISTCSNIQALLDKYIKY